MLSEEKVLYYRNEHGHRHGMLKKYESIFESNFYDYVDNKLRPIFDIWSRQYNLSISIHCDYGIGGIYVFIDYLNFKQIISYTYHIKDFEDVNRWLQNLENEIERETNKLRKTYKDPQNLPWGIPSCPHCGAAIVRTRTSCEFCGCDY